MQGCNDALCSAFGQSLGLLTGRNLVTDVPRIVMTTATKCLRALRALSETEG
jgi:hypothetical protein